MLKYCENTLQLSIAFLCLLLQGKTKLNVNSIGVYKDENFNNSNIIIKLDCRNLWYIKFPQIGYKFNDGIFILNSSAMKFPYKFQIQGIFSSQEFIIEFNPRNEFSVNKIDLFNFTKPEINKPQFEKLKTKKLLLHNITTSEIEIKSKDLSLRKNSVEINLNTFNKLNFYERK